MVAPCLCSGSLKYIHYDCLIRWIIYGNKIKCEICNIPFKITEVRKPIYLWGITGVSKVSSYLTRGPFVALWQVSHSVMSFENPICKISFKHDLKKFVTNMMMLIVAFAAMIGSIYLFCTTDRDRDHEELRDKEQIYYNPVLTVSSL